MNLKAVWTLLKDTVTEWQADKVPLLAAALAYYTVFSLAPLLVIVIAIAGFVFGPEAARNQLDEQIQGLVGRQGAEAIQTMIQSASHPSSGIVATVISVVTLLLGASGVFAQLQDALNTIWEIPPSKEGVKGMVKARATSFAMVLVIGFLLLVSLVASAALAGIGNFFGHLIPGLAILWQLVNFVISFGVITLLFGLIYRVLPDVRVPWGDVWHGAIVTSLLFTVGKWLLGLYLGNSGVASPYGAAGSFVVVLVWVYYSAQILLFGAEFTQVYSKHYGSKWRLARSNTPLDAQNEAPKLGQER
ncbi:MULTISPECIES: YihY/virulence factor BrkB family protein [Trichocoleus]|uniref:YihY/virulence factor BrkB family protein n=1 Tax=Trichocoleus desertorum GB2-A4 TaxID=2933944 RepID=A0ABV0J9A4_9CYAN|nr:MULTISPECIES: YihY/virulence factor BrkB family protein [unclassified Trichocoleus]MBD1864730.1 YihY/virulence factor BrkB family protein [Trichocoleus sp. FACHB-46]MBD2120373.1 YihY/virulence factor BrkB family protein [Trichocoleus sp. FACHB-262]